MHLQAKHFFPKDYDFFIVNDGIDKRSSMLRIKHRRRSSAASRAVHRGQKPNGVNHRSSMRDPVPDAQSKKVVVEQPLSQISSTETDSHSTPPAPDLAEMDGLTSTMSALKFVPPSVRFGRGGRAAGLGRR